MLPTLEPITAEVIQVPRYVRCNLFSQFLEMNYAALTMRFRALCPEARGDDFLDFARSNWDLYGRTL